MLDSWASSEEECATLLPSSGFSNLQVDRFGLSPLVTPETIDSSVYGSTEESVHETLLYYCSDVQYQAPFAVVCKKGAIKLIEEGYFGKQTDVKFEWCEEQDAFHFESESKSQRVSQSVFDFLTMRLELESSHSNVTIFLKGGKRLGMFLFNGRSNDVIQFTTVLREYVNTLTLRDKFCKGELFLLERKQPSCSEAIQIGVEKIPNIDEEDSSALLCDPFSRPGENRSPKRNFMSRTRKMVLRKPKRPRRARSRGQNGVEFAIEIEQGEGQETRRGVKRESTSTFRDRKGCCEVWFSNTEEKQVPLSLEAWESEQDENGRIVDPTVMKQAIHCSGLLEGSCRSTVWPFILGYYPWDSSYSERKQIDAVQEIRFKALQSKWVELRTAAVLHEMKAHDLGLSKRSKLSDRLRKEYASCLLAEAQINKDVVRTDRHLEIYSEGDTSAATAMRTVLNVYAYYNTEIGYCQGMSDFVSVLICVLGTEQEGKVFWCFVNLMKRVEESFDMDQVGLRYQLSQFRRLMDVVDPELSAFITNADTHWHSFFRWIFMLFKRELSIKCTMRLWEALWTTNRDENDFHLYVAAAVLLIHKEEILSIQSAFDSLLRWVNDLKPRIDVNRAIREGRLLYRMYGPTAK